MTHITQQEVDDNWPDIIKDIDKEIIRSKSWINESGYHYGTSLSIVVRRYRDELKMLKRTLSDNISDNTKL